MYQCLCFIESAILILEVRVRIIVLAFYADSNSLYPYCEMSMEYNAINTHPITARFEMEAGIYVLEDICSLHFYGAV